MSCCSSPIEYFIEYADFAFQNSGFTMEDVLTIGHVFPNTINMCCPDFCSKEYMLLGQGMQSIVDYNVFGPGFNFDNCCVNAYFLFDNFLNISTGYLEKPLLPPGQESTLHQTYRACCNTNDTARCISELLEHTNSTALKEWFYTEGVPQGLFEYNIINQKFGFCELVEILKTKTPAVAEEYMLAILELGLVVSCRPNGTFVGSLETYVNTYYAP